MRENSLLWTINRAFVSAVDAAYATTMSNLQGRRGPNSRVFYGRAQCYGMFVSISLLLNLNHVLYGLPEHHVYAVETCGTPTYFYLYLTLSLTYQYPSPFSRPDRDERGSNNTRKETHAVIPHLPPIHCSANDASCYAESALTSSLDHRFLTVTTRSTLKSRTDTLAWWTPIVIQRDMRVKPKT